MKKTIPQGTLEALSSQPIKTWTGWVIFYWDMCHCCMLFREEPKKDYLSDGEWWGWKTSGAIEGIGPDFLTACGIDIPWDVMGPEGHGFYYGPDCHEGMHPPIEIQLTLPVPLLEQLRLI
jgi:hypothetical protein